MAAARVRAAHLRELREKRLQVARANAKWMEVEAVDLVERDSFLVSARTDRLYRPYAGTVFSSDTIVVISDLQDLAYTVAEDGTLAFYEPVGRPKTWSEHVRRRTEKEQRKAAPRERPAWMEQTS